MKIEDWLHSHLQPGISRLSRVAQLVLKNKGTLQVSIVFSSAKEGLDLSEACELCYYRGVIETLIALDGAPAGKLFKSLLDKEIASQAKW